MAHGRFVMSSSAVPRLDVSPLEGQLVRLEPLSEAHVDALVLAAGEDRSTFGYTSVPTTRIGLVAQIASLLAARDAGEAVPFAQVRVVDDAPVGMTRYLTLRRREELLPPYAVEIGGTWLSASAQRTGINLEAKLLLMSHAFDTWRVGRVDFKTDARNHRSRSALEGLGATFEGVLRSWQPSQVSDENDQLRDSAMYSVTSIEWPNVREQLEVRLRRQG